MLSKKHRPTKFSEVLGQDGLVMELKERSTKMDFNENIMLYGNSGTGKTSVAYIISALLSDPDPIINEDGTKDPNPESLSTKAIFDEVFNRDVSFHDASSMEDRDIHKLEGLLSAEPLYDKARIVIIDEAQELTKSGKGATLRLLEKKRENVYIILCTMDYKAFDKSVVSRCVPYRFRPLTTHFNAMNLYGILKREGLDKEVPDEFIDKGIFAIADCSEGSARVAIQYLERALAGKIYTEDALLKEFSVFTADYFKSIIYKLIEKDVTVLRDIIEIEPGTFFFKSEAVIQGAMIYKCSGYVDKGWKKETADKLISHPNYEALIQTYKDIRSEMRYYNDTLMLYYIIKFLEAPTNVAKKSSKPAVNRRTVIKR